MKVAEYAQFDGVGLAEQIANSEISTEEAHDAARKAIGQVNDELNALAQPLFDQPLSYEADGAFAGIPFLIKDFGLHARDVPTRLGSRLTGPGIPFPYDTGLMSRFREAGLATLGVTTTPEMAYSLSTESVLHGPTRNPWDPRRSPGGSSGGTAALVAAGAIPLGHGNDGAGSLRVPAGWCGLVGLKPSRGRITVGPDYADPLLGRGAEFALTRSVRDSAALLDAVEGPGIGERFVLPGPPRPYAETVERDPEQLRIGFTTEAWNGVRAEDEQADALRMVARELDSLGHDVTESRPEFDHDAFHLANRRAFSGFLALGVQDVAEALGVVPGPENLEATVWEAVQNGRKMTALEILEAGATDNVVTRQVAEWFTDYDVLLTPTSATGPPMLGTLDSNDASLDEEGWWQVLLEHCPFSVLFNATGAPALSLPLAEAQDGLPIGVQIVGRYPDDSTVLGLAAQLEAALPWADRLPGIHVGEEDRQASGIPGKASVS